MFKQKTGDNFTNYVTKMKMEKAKELLRKRGCNVYLVGQNVGYSNPSYFAKVFKSINGMSPSEYSNIHE
jgi:two-component system response regulator YesN